MASECSGRLLRQVRQFPRAESKSLPLRKMTPEERVVVDGWQSRSPGQIYGQFLPSTYFFSSGDNELILTALTRGPISNVCSRAHPVTIISDELRTHRSLSAVDGRPGDNALSEEAQELHFRIVGHRSDLSEVLRLTSLSDALPLSL